MNNAMTAPAGQQLVGGLRLRYAAGMREEKIRILSEFALVSSLHRKSAIRVLNAEAEAEEPLKRARGRVCTTSPCNRRWLLRKRVIGPIQDRLEISWPA
jgi:hypothetical protein